MNECAVCPDNTISTGGAASCTSCEAGTEPNLERTECGTGKYSCWYYDNMDTKQWYKIMREKSKCSNLHCFISTTLSSLLSLQIVESLYHGHQQKISGRGNAELVYKITFSDRRQNRLQKFYFVDLGRWGLRVHYVIATLSVIIITNNLFTDQMFHGHNYSRS